MGLSLDRLLDGDDHAHDANGVVFFILYNASSLDQDAWY